LSIILLLSAAASGYCGQNTGIAPVDAGLVNRALAAELNAAQDTRHPMRYRLHKTSPRLSSTKEIVETRDGAVAMLVAIDDRALQPADAQKEQVRLDALLADPSRQRHRKQTQDDDTGRALRVLRAMPKAFVFQYGGEVRSESGTLEKFSFSPNPRFNPLDLETQVLTELSGDILVDAAHERVVRLEGHLQQDVDFGWGVLGRLNKGGWIVIEQANVGKGQWRVVRFKMVMSGRVFFKTRSFDTTEEESEFAPVPLGMSYLQAIEMMRAGRGNLPSGAEAR
jgi:hypothetical protein